MVKRDNLSTLLLFQGDDLSRVLRLEHARHLLGGAAAPHLSPSSRPDVGLLRVVGQALPQV